MFELSLYDSVRYGFLACFGVIALVALIELYYLVQGVVDGEPVPHRPLYGPESDTNLKP
jgi:hypothetical protein